LIVGSPIPAYLTVFGAAVILGGAMSFLPTTARTTTDLLLT